MDTNNPYLIEAEGTNLSPWRVIAGADRTKRTGRLRRGDPSSPHVGAITARA